MTHYLYKLLVCREISAVYFSKHTKHINIFCWENEWNSEVKWHNTWCVQFLLYFKWSNVF